MFVKTFVLYVHIITLRIKGKDYWEQCANLRKGAQSD